MSVKKLGIGDLQNFVNGSVQASNEAAAAMQKNVIPVVTTAQRNALATDGTGVTGGLRDGLVVYNSTTHKLNVYCNNAWEAVTSA